MSLKFSPNEDDSEEGSLIKHTVAKTFWNIKFTKYIDDNILYVLEHVYK
jgi:hypothetical protein